MEKQGIELKLLQDSFWRERILGARELSVEKLRKRMEVLQLKCSGPYYCVILFAPYVMEKEADQIDSILARLLKTIREDYRRHKMTCYTVTDNYCNIAAILSLASEKSYHTLNSLTQKMAANIISQHDVKMFVGIGELVQSIGDLSVSKDSAAEALAHKFTFSRDHVIAARDVKRYYNQSENDLRMHYDRVFGCFYDGNMELLAVRLRSLFGKVAGESADPLNHIRNICIEMTASLLRIVREMGVARTPELDGIYTYIAQVGSVDALEEWFLSYCGGLMQEVEDLRKSKTWQIMDLAEAFIEEKIGDPELSVQTISDYVDLSPSYFSNMFFRTKGIHVNEYINRTRIRYAQKQLLETNTKVAAIGQSLGFSSSSYFNNVFKRYTGMTPSRFREKGKAEKSAQISEE